MNLNILNFSTLFNRYPLKLWLKPCDTADPEQKWFFTNYNQNGIPPRLHEEATKEEL